jgi:hypothetical protein
MDLFIVFRDAGRWGEPRHLGTDVNSPLSDAEARLSPDSRTLYFSSERVVRVGFPQTGADARNNLGRLSSWDNGLYNIWEVSLAPWLDAHAAEQLQHRK